MLQMLDAMLESELGAYLVAGLAVAGTIIFGVLAVAVVICAFIFSPWLLFVAGFILSGLLAGLCGGLASYAFDYC